MSAIFKWLVKLVILGFVITAIVIASIWEPDRTVDQLKHWTNEQSQFVNVMGMNVHVRDEGPRSDATPMVLLHGTSASLHTWDGWNDALVSQHRVIRMDLPGFGLTGPFVDHNFKMSHYVDFVHELLGQLGVKQVIIAGNSFGGHIAWEYASRYPNEVKQLILVDSAGYPSNAASVPIGFKIAQIPVLNQLMDHVLPRSIIESSVKNVYGDPSKVTPALVNRYFELTLRQGNRQSLKERFTQAPSGENVNAIKQLKVPTLILWGGKDQLIPVEDGKQFQKDIEGSQLVIYPELGHIPHEEDPMQTTQTVQTFIRQHTLTTQNP